MRTIRMTADIKDARMFWNILEQLGDSGGSFNKHRAGQNIGAKTLL
jgi:hypothetical protein